MNENEVEPTAAPLHLTKREYYAAHIMAGLCAAGMDDVDFYVRTQARLAVQIADELMKALDGEGE